jgi:hypothetical protein
VLTVELVLVLVGVNFAPFVVHLLLGERFAWAVDGGARWGDGRPLLGTHKTLRGALAGVLVGAAGGLWLGVGAGIGAFAGLLAMLGDLLTSFAKRRLGHASGAPVFGLDQALEGGLPMLVLAPALDLSVVQSLVTVALFAPVSHAGALFWRYVLYRPSPGQYPRIIRASTRLREWRACHTPLARWQGWLNFESYVYYRVVMAQAFRLLGLHRRGVANVLAVPVNHVELPLAELPAPFDGYRILLLTDLHLDGLDGLTEVLIDRVRGLEVDLCLLGGDVRMEMYGPMAPALRRLRQLLAHVRARDGILGVLGNHDCIEMLPEFEEAGVRMLVNDATAVVRDGETLCVVGLDDPHYYRCHDLERAFRGLPPGAFKVLLAHSPEVYREAVGYGTRLYLCGHTHGGQICLPWVGPLFTHSAAPRFTAAGRWEYRGMVGYTSRGAGASGVPLRFNCLGEVPLITLRCAPDGVLKGACAGSAALRPQVGGAHAGVG